MDLARKKSSETAEVEHTSQRPHFVPDVDIFETKEGVTLLADLPGVTKENVSLTVEEGVLTLTGRVEENLPEGARSRYRESEAGDFYRSFRLGREVAGDKVEASMKDGVLRLDFPKTEWARTRKIEVK
jgi:HSP20 family molecular chaperone IbpA